MVWYFWHPADETYLEASTQSLVVFPIFGLIVGAATNWLSLLVIFSPVEPINVGEMLCGSSEMGKAMLPTPHEEMKSRTPQSTSMCCGPFILHGLFLRRQREVSAVYGRLIGSEVLTTPALVRAILNGSSLPNGPKVGATCVALLSVFFLFVNI